jgi:hypothetical protein
MTNTLFSAKASGTGAATVVRRLLLLAMTAAMLTLAGCGDSGEDSDDDASHACCHTLATDR